MFHTILLAAWTLFHLYIFWRVVSLPFFQPRPRKYLLAVTLALLWGTDFVPQAVNVSGLFFMKEPVDMFRMNWLGTTFLVFTCLLIVDLITVFGLLFKRFVTPLRVSALAAGLLLSAFALYQGHRAPAVRSYDIHLAGLAAQTDSLVLVGISDLHVGTSLDEAWLADRVDQVNALRPDVIVILGDIFEGDSPGERKKGMIRLFRSLSAPLGVWSVTGNHESHGGLGSAVDYLESAGVHMLRNQWSEVTSGLILAGVDDGHDHSPGSDSPSRIEQALRGRPDSCATVFLSHRPVGAPEVAAAGTGLMLCGHTHGGQLWPFSYISGLANPLLAGKYVVNGMPVIVCRGTGTWGPRMRLWHPGEILRVVLRPVREEAAPARATDTCQAK